MNQVVGKLRLHYRRPHNQRQNEPDGTALHCHMLQEERQEPQESQEPRSPKTVQIDRSLDTSGSSMQSRGMHMERAGSRIDWDSLGVQQSYPRRDARSLGQPRAGTAYCRHCRHCRLSVDMCRLHAFHIEHDLYATCPYVNICAICIIRIEADSDWCSLVWALDRLVVIDW